MFIKESNNINYSRTKETLFWILEILTYRKGALLRSNLVALARIPLGQGKHRKRYHMMSGSCGRWADHTPQVGVYVYAYLAYLYSVYSVHPIERIQAAAISFDFAFPTFAFRFSLLSLSRGSTHSTLSVVVLLYLLSISGPA